jgi:hypothetical protein
MSIVSIIVTLPLYGSCLSKHDIWLDHEIPFAYAGLRRNAAKSSAISVVKARGMNTMR